VVPDWVWEHFPDTPAYLFVHKSDLPDHTSGGKHMFDLYNPGLNESWEWTDGEQTVWPDRYAAVYSCKKAQCPKRNEELLLIEVDDVMKNGRAALQVVPPAKKKCPSCQQALEHKVTRKVGFREVWD
jgi:hypothetical protein